jgi:hypothetical protein
MIGSGGAQSITDALKINQSITNMDLSSMTPNHPLFLPIHHYHSHQCNIPQQMRLVMMVLNQLQMHSRSISPSPT